MAPGNNSIFEITHSQIDTKLILLLYLFYQFGLLDYMFTFNSIREDSQIDFVTRNVPWTFRGGGGGGGFCLGRFFCHK